MVDFKVDTDKLQSAINKYQKELDELKRIKTSLETCIESLKESGWNSKAGEEALRNFESTWSKDLEKYKSYIEFLVSTLKYAKGEFEELVVEASKLQTLD